MKEGTKPGIAEPQEKVETTDERTDGVVEEKDFIPEKSGSGEDAVEELAEETEQEATDSEEEADPLDEDASSEDSEELDELSLDDFMKPKDSGEDKKSGVEKRIDKLVAEKNALEEKLNALKEQVDTPKETSKKYTRAQLMSAMKDAMENQDTQLMWEIMDYRVKESQEELKNEYLQEQKKAVEQQTSMQREWTSVLEDYAYLADPTEPELYRGARRELNIKDAKSLIYQLANKLYTDPANTNKYRVPGGMKVAVSDALTRIIRQRKISPAKNKETATLKKKLAKEKRKSTMSSGKSTKSESVKKPLSSRDSLEEYIEERRKLLASKRGM